MRPNLLISAALPLLLLGCAPEAQEEPIAEFGEAPAAELPAAQPFVDEGPDEHLIYQGNEITWEEAPPSLERGAETAVLEGDPAEAGIFTMRIRMPDGFLISPHSHPNVERVTVISGNFHLGSGEEVDREVTEALAAGGYTSIPPETPHYAIAEGETVVQLTSVGPWELNYVNPEDDPRRR